MRGFSGQIRWVLFLALTGLFGIFGPFGSISILPESFAGELGSVAQSALPLEAQKTLALIKEGGPFPYPQKDGSVFGNFEKHLPIKPRGYYLEYTVPRPGDHDRGPRRIIAGKGQAGEVRTSGEYYYTEDHYRHFRRIVEATIP